MRIRLLIMLTGFVLGACKSNSNIDNIAKAPVPTAADEVFQNVYQPLDGTWKGVFKIYEDQDRGKRSPRKLENIGVSHLRKASLKHTNTIEVTQVYTSESPYFQRVRITDVYKDEAGSTKTVESKGVNKVQNGKMWCVVKKPDETIIHEGSLDGKKTIIWQRAEQQPQKVEYFKETVEADVYEIIGYGYYEGDDLDLMPKYWFYGRYNRVR